MDSVLPSVYDEDTEQFVPDYCQYYNVDPENVDPEQGLCPVSDFLNDTSLECLPKNDILYPEDFEFTSNIVTDFNLVCKDQYKVSGTNDIARFRPLAVPISN